MRPANLGDMGYPLLISALGAPMVYLVLGITFGERTAIGGYDFAVAAVAFATAYGFSLVVTGFFLLVTLLVAGHVGLSRHTTWSIVAAWPLVLGIVAGLAYDATIGGMVFAMGFANAIIFGLCRRGPRKGEGRPTQ